MEIAHGINSVRNSQAYHLIFSKKIYDNDGLSVSPYAGPIYIQEHEEFNVVGGLTVRKGKASLMGMWSGTDTHIVAKYELTKHHSAGIVWWGLETTGATVGFQF